MEDMTTEEIRRLKKLETLKNLIDEENYPYYEDSFLLSQIDNTNSITDLAIKLCLEKSGIPDIKLGDVTIKSPKEHFLRLVQLYRSKSVDEYGNLSSKKSQILTKRRADRRDEFEVLQKFHFKNY